MLDVGGCQQPPLAADWLQQVQSSPRGIVSVYPWRHWWAMAHHTASLLKLAK